VVRSVKIRIQDPQTLRWIDVTTITIALKALTDITLKTLYRDIISNIMWSVNAFSLRVEA